MATDLKEIRNRIVDHVTVRAGDLVPNERNFRTHSAFQRNCVKTAMEMLGFCRSLLGFKTADGRYKLIDGHMRAELDPDAMVTLEVLDVDEDEAAKLLAIIDPSAALATVDADKAVELGKYLNGLDQKTANFFDLCRQAGTAVAEKLKRECATQLPEDFYVLVECDDEQHQRDLLQRFMAEGLHATAKLA